VAPVIYNGQSYTFRRDCWGWYLPVDYHNEEPREFAPFCFGSEMAGPLVLDSAEYLFSLNGSFRNTGVFEDWDGNWPLFYGLLKQQPVGACALPGCVGEDLDNHHYHLLCWAETAFDVRRVYDEIVRRRRVVTKLKPEWSLG